jgi:hypothetical protein
MWYLYSNFRVFQKIVFGLKAAAVAIYGDGKSVFFERPPMGIYALHDDGQRLSDASAAAAAFRISFSHYF